MKKNITIILAGIGILCGCNPKKTTYGQGAPNIVLIVADDLGYSDLGCFGSEIATPNLDALAGQSQIFTSFYTAATCSPTRAMLLSGTDHHVAGLGNMAERIQQLPHLIGKPGYEGHLNDRVVSVAELLQHAGYHTYMAGKWHLGLTADQSPQARGFERSFALLDAYTNHFQPYEQNTFWEDDHFGKYPAGKFSTDFYTDKLIEYFLSNKDDGKPFLLYAAYTAPHWPLQAPQEYIDRYKGQYDVGYDSLRVVRFDALKTIGIIPEHAQLPALPAVKGNLYDISDKPLRPWTSLSKSEQRIEARKMEIYAAMITNLDDNIGRLISSLKKSGEYDNTLFIFLSDNGAAALEQNSTPNESDPYNDMGTVNSFVAYGPAWAHVSSAVNRLYKGYTAEGGIHTPMIIRMPNQTEGKGIVRAFTTVMDITPTLLELAGVQYPTTFNGKAIAPLQGSSLLPLLSSQKESVHADDYVMGWELFERGAIRKGKWKICKVEPPFGKPEFELFDLEKDPAESHDLSKEFPEKYHEMLGHWEEYVKDNGVILLGK